jgi:hypothetical protein
MSENKRVFIKNANMETGTYNPNLPFWFCDVDGVINAIPFERKWVGTDEQAKDTFELMDRNNWALERLHPNLETNFELDNEIVLEFDRNDEYQGILDPKLVTLKIRYSTELITQIRDLIVDNKINFVWLTTWKRQAVTKLNPIFGFPPETPYLEWRTDGDDGQYNKIGGILDLYDDYKRTNPEETPQPFIWVDDVVTKDYVTTEKDKSRNYNNVLTSHTSNANLVIQTDPFWGISRDEMNRIQEFIRNPK